MKLETSTAPSAEIWLPVPEDFEAVAAAKVDDDEPVLEAVPGLVVVAVAVDEIDAVAVDAAAQTELAWLTGASLHSSASNSAKGSYVTPGHAAVHL